VTDRKSVYHEFFSGATVRLFVNDRPVADVIPQPDGSWTHSVTSGLTAGEYRVVSVVMDGAGNVSGPSPAALVVVPGADGNSQNAGGSGGGGCGVGSALATLMAVLIACFLAVANPIFLRQGLK
jgi:hypothetical protein